MILKFILVKVDKDIIRLTWEAILISSKKVLQAKNILRNKGGMLYPEKRNK